MIQSATNPIAIRSQEWLANALLSLMEEKKFRDISIQQIAERADLSRRTFYRVFGTKEDALIWHLNLLYEEFFSLLRQRECRQFQDVLALYFSFWYQHAHLFALLKKSDLLPFVLNQYLRVFPDVFTTIKREYPLSQNPDALAYAMAFSAGGMLSVLIKWADEGMIKTPDEIMQMVDVMMQLPPQAQQSESRRNS